MDDLTLVIMAAGIGSRFKGGVKQLAKVGPNDETIMELAIKDAASIGYKKIVFIIREELKNDFEELIIPKIKGLIEYDFAYQKVPESIKRTKPLGTGQALLCLKDIVKGNFIVLNADDYYGKEALQKLYDHFKNYNNEHAIVTYYLKNTFVSSNTGNRGVCYVKDGILTKIEETYHINKIGDEFKTDDKILDPNTLVSMNLWGFNQSIFKYLEDKFNEFLQNSTDLENDEFLIPTVINDLINENGLIRVYNSEEICFGITYKEDVALFKKGI